MRFYIGQKVWGELEHRDPEQRGIVEVIGVDYIVVRGKDKKPHFIEKRDYYKITRKRQEM